MRKLFFFLMSLIVVSLVACSREESVINNPNLLKKQSVDYDLNSDRDVEVDASVGISRKKEGALEFIISTLFKFLMSAEDIYCGSAYLKYFEEPERWLDFPNNGMRILVSESGN